MSACWRNGGAGVRSRPWIETDGDTADERGDPFADLEGCVLGGEVDCCCKDGRGCEGGGCVGC